MFFFLNTKIYFFPQDLCVKHAGKSLVMIETKSNINVLFMKNQFLFSCAQCDHTTPLKSNLNRHTKRHSKTHLTSNLPPKIARREPLPNIIDPPANDHLLEQLENQEIQSMFEQNTQRGFGIFQMTAADTTLPDEIQQFFRDERPWGTDRNLRQVYVKTFPRICDSETLN